MKNLLLYIFSKLSESQKPVYLEVAPRKDPNTNEPLKYPYIVFRLPNSVNVESDRQDYVLQIDVWDNQTDTTNLEILTDDIDKRFYKLQHIDEHQFLKFERENRLMVPDPDPSIKRRQLRYTVKHYER